MLCPLHISRSDAPIGLRCSRRQIGTKPSNVASAPHSHWPNGAQYAMRTFASVGTRKLYNTVRFPGWCGEGVLFITTLSCVVHVRLPIGRRHRAILNMFNIARRPPDGLPMRPRQPIPGREPIHIGQADSIGAQSGRRIGQCEAGIRYSSILPTALT